MGSTLLPLTENFKKALWAKKLEPLGKFLGGMTLLWDIVTTLFDKNMDVADKAGRISIAMLGFGIGSYVGALIGAAFFPVAAAIITAAFAITLTLILMDFSEIYYSLLFDRRFRHQLLTLKA